MLLRKKNFRGASDTSSGRIGYKAVFFSGKDPEKGEKDEKTIGARFTCGNVLLFGDLRRLCGRDARYHENERDERSCR